MEIHNRVDRETTAVEAFVMDPGKNGERKRRVIASAPARRKGTHKCGGDIAVVDCGSFIEWAVRMKCGADV